MIKVDNMPATLIESGQTHATVYLPQIWLTCWAKTKTKNHFKQSVQIGFILSLKKNGNKKKY